MGLLGTGGNCGLGLCCSELWEACDPSSTFIFAVVQDGFCLGFCREVFFQRHLGSLISFKFRLKHGLGRSGCPVLMDTTLIKWHLSVCVS